MQPKSDVILYRHESSVRAVGVMTGIVTTLFLTGLIVYARRPFNVPTAIVMAIATVIIGIVIIGSLQYVVRGGVWSLLIDTSRIEWKCPDHGDRLIPLSDIDHFCVRHFEGSIDSGGHDEVWLVFADGEKARVPPNCIADELKVWSALAKVLRRNDAEE